MRGDDDNETIVLSYNISPAQFTHRVLPSELGIHLLKCRSRVMDLRAWVDMNAYSKSGNVNTQLA